MQIKFLAYAMMWVLLLASGSLVAIAGLTIDKYLLAETVCESVSEIRRVSGDEAGGQARLGALADQAEEDCGKLLGKGRGPAELRTQVSLKR